MKNKTFEKCTNNTSVPSIASFEDLLSTEVIELDQNDDQFDEKDEASKNPDPNLLVEFPNRSLVAVDTFKNDTEIDDKETSDQNHSDTSSSEDAVILNTDDAKSENESCTNANDQSTLENSNDSLGGEGVIFMGWNNPPESGTVETKKSNKESQQQATSSGGTMNRFKGLRSIGRKQKSGGIWQGVRANNVGWQSKSPQRQHQGLLKDITAAAAATASVLIADNQSDDSGKDSGESSVINESNEHFSNEADGTAESFTDNSVTIDPRYSENDKNDYAVIKSEIKSEAVQMEPKSPPTFFRRIDRQASTGSAIFNNDEADNFTFSPQKQQIHHKRKQQVRKTKIPSKSFTHVRVTSDASQHSTEECIIKDFVQIKPYHAYPEGFQMSASELYQETMRKSTNFEVLTSSQTEKQIGCLDVEVLSCIGLPQTRRSKPNSIAYLVCGDVAFATDIITNSSSPQWPARSKRAATIPLFHAFARLYTGIFSVTDKDNDDFTGRNVIDIATLRPNTYYDVTLPLRTSNLVYDRSPRGAVRLRFRLKENENRAFLLSYIPLNMKQMKQIMDKSIDNVTIPCADSKTIHNVAYTIYGKDLPGKYSKSAFRATNRELNLYKFNLPIVSKRILTDLMRYEKPNVSFYTFIGWMSIVHYKAYEFFPSFLVSILLFLHVNNYHDVISTSKVQKGFEPPTLTEMLSILLWGSQINKNETKQPQLQCSSQKDYIKTVGDLQFPIEDNLEFPYSEAKYSRLNLNSMIYPKEMPIKKKSNDSECVDDADKFEDTDEDEADVQEEILVSKESLRQTVPSGPEQDNNVQSKELNLQENFMEIERFLHRLTGNLFHQKVSRSIDNSNDIEDKGIGTQPNKFTNPLAALSATFLEPVMNALSVYVIANRAVFNICAWKDPYLSFWFMMILVFLMTFLALFPWRSFFWCVGLLCFGPQNFILGKKPKNMVSQCNEDDDDSDECEDVTEERVDNSQQKNKKRFKLRGKKADTNKNSGISKEEEEETTTNAYDCRYERSLFSTQHAQKLNKKKNAMQRLEIIVPYTRTRRERFYFWPSSSLIDSSVTSATQDSDSSDKKVL